MRHKFHSFKYCLAGIDITPGVNKDMKWRVFVFVSPVISKQYTYAILVLMRVEETLTRTLTLSALTQLLFSLDQD